MGIVLRVVSVQVMVSALWTLRVHKHLIVRAPWYATPVKGCASQRAGRSVSGKGTCDARKVVNADMSIATYAVCSAAPYLVRVGNVKSMLSVGTALCVQRRLLQVQKRQLERVCERVRQMQIANSSDRPLNVQR